MHTLHEKVFLVDHGKFFLVDYKSLYLSTMQLMRNISDTDYLIGGDDEIYAA